jgi:hypothetical protein
MNSSRDIYFTSRELQLHFLATGLAKRPSYCTWHERMFGGNLVAIVALVSAYRQEIQYSDFDAGSAQIANMPRFVFVSLSGASVAFWSGEPSENETPTYGCFSLLLNVLHWEGGPSIV